MYHYGGNNPIKYSDPTGEAIAVIPFIAPTVIAGAKAIGAWLASLFVVGTVATAVGVTIDAAIDDSKSESLSDSSTVPSPLIDSGVSSAGAMPPSPDDDDGDKKNNSPKPQKKEPASEKTAKSMAKQIEKDLGKDARREFHDAKQGEDRSLQELKEDASQLYKVYGKEIPKWMRIEQ